MGTLDNRLARIEHRAGSDDQARARLERDAESFRTRILAMAEGFAEEDRQANEPAQAGWSQASRLAWALRFDRDRTRGLIADLRERSA